MRRFVRYDGTQHMEDSTSFNFMYKIIFEELAGIALQMLGAFSRCLAPAFARTSVERVLSVH